MSVAHEHVIVGMICKHVLIGSHPILQVVHEFDGMWSFSCATEPHPEIDAYAGLCLECSMNKMSEFQLLKHMKPGEWASRKSADSIEWSMFQMPPDEE